MAVIARWTLPIAVSRPYAQTALRRGPFSYVSARELLRRGATLLHL
jgi:hypothetical protein